MNIDKLIQLTISKNDCDVTKLVKLDWNLLSEEEFINKYFCTKQTYLNRVVKFGDPYSNRGLLFNIIKILTK